MSRTNHARFMFEMDSRKFVVYKHVRTFLNIQRQYLDFSRMLYKMNVGYVTTMYIKQNLKSLANLTKTAQHFRKFQLPAHGYRIH